MVCADHHLCMTNPEPAKIAATATGSRHHSRRRHWYSWRRIRRKLTLDRRNVAVQVALGLVCAFVFFRIVLFLLDRL